MVQSINISLSHGELTQLINDAVSSAIDRRLMPTKQDELLTDEQAQQYLKCSSVFLWKRRKEGKIKALNAGKKVLYPLSALNEYINNKGGCK